MLGPAIFAVVFVGVATAAVRRVTDVVAIVLIIGEETDVKEFNFLFSTSDSNCSLGLMVMLQYYDWKQHCKKIIVSPNQFAKQDGVDQTTRSAESDKTKEND